MAHFEVGYQGHEPVEFQSFEEYGNLVVAIVSNPHIGIGPDTLGIARPAAEFAAPPPFAETALRPGWTAIFPSLHLALMDLTRYSFEVALYHGQFPHTDTVIVSIADLPGAHPAPPGGAFGCEGAHQANPPISAIRVVCGSLRFP